MFFDLLILLLPPHKSHLANTGCILETPAGLTTTAVVHPPVPQPATRPGQRGLTSSEERRRKQTDRGKASKRMIVFLFPFSVDKSVSHRLDYSPLHKKGFYFISNFYFLYSPGKNESLMWGKRKPRKRERERGT